MMSYYAHERRWTLNLLFHVLVFTLLQFVGLVHSGIWQQNELPVRTIHGIEGKITVMFDMLDFFYCLLHAYAGYFLFRNMCAFDVSETATYFFWKQL